MPVVLKLLISNIYVSISFLNIRAPSLNHHPQEDGPATRLDAADAPCDNPLLKRSASARLEFTTATAIAVAFLRHSPAAGPWTLRRASCSAAMSSVVCQGDSNTCWAIAIVLPIHAPALQRALALACFP